MPENPPVSIGFLGDIMLARGVQRHFLQKPDDFEMQDIRACLADCDHIHANLESPVSDTGSPDPRQDPNVCFRADPGMVDVLSRLAVSSVSLANNHVLDYGHDALYRTLSILDDAQIARFGAGANAAEANEPLVQQIGAYKVGFVGSNFIFSASTRKAGRKSPGAADFQLRKLTQSVKDLKARVDIVVVSVHWGLEYSFYPLPYIQRAARSLVDAGAQLIIGHGPHYVQPIERYRDGCIVYSLGNFIFDEPFRFSNISFALVVRLDDHRVHDIEIHPVEICEEVPRLMQGWLANRTRRFVEAGARGFARKSDSFWQNLSNTYFSAMMHRAKTTRSLKYLTANPIKFYQDVGSRNFLRKIGLGRK